MCIYIAMFKRSSSIAPFRLHDSPKKTAGVGSWGQISGRFANRSPTECARQWAIGPRAQLPPEHATGAVASIPVGGAGHAGIGGRWGISLGEHQQYHHHQQQQHHHHYHHHLAHQGGGGIATVAPADGSSLAAAAAAAATAGLGTGPRSSDRMPPDFSQAARQARGMPASAAAAGLAGVVPFGSPGGGMGGSGSSGRGPKGVGSWTKEEDDRLNNLVAMYGVKWSQVRTGEGVAGENRMFRLGAEVRLVLDDDHLSMRRESKRWLTDGVGSGRVRLGARKASLSSHLSHKGIPLDRRGCLFSFTLS